MPSAVRRNGAGQGGRWTQTKMITKRKQISAVVTAIALTIIVVAAVSHEQKQEVSRFFVTWIGLVKQGRNSEALRLMSSEYRARSDMSAFTNWLNTYVDASWSQDKGAIIKRVSWRKWDLIDHADWPVGRAYRIVHEDGHCRMTDANINYQD